MKNDVLDQFDTITPGPIGRFVAWVQGIHWWQRLLWIFVQALICAFIILAEETSIPPKKGENFGLWMGMAMVPTFFGASIKMLLMGFDYINRKYLNGVSLTLNQMSILSYSFLCSIVWLITICLMAYFW